MPKLFEHPPVHISHLLNAEPVAYLPYRRASHAREVWVEDLDGHLIDRIDRGTVENDHLEAVMRGWLKQLHTNALQLENHDGFIVRLSSYGCFMCIMRHEGNIVVGRGVVFPERPK